MVCMCFGSKRLKCDIRSLSGVVVVFVVGEYLWSLCKCVHVVYYVGVINVSVGV